MPQDIPSFHVRPGDLPVIGNWVSKIGRINALAHVACAPDPTIAVWAFFHQIPFLVYTLAVPDCESVIVDRFRGKGHHRKRHIHFREGVPVEGRPHGPGWGWRIWTLYDLKERIGWYWTIIDAGLDFQINWMTTTYQWQGCDVPSPGYAEWLAGPNEFVLLGGTGWQPLVMNATNVHGIPIGPNSFAIASGTHYSFAYSIQSVPGTFVPEAHPIEARLIDGAGDVVARGTPDRNRDGTWTTSLTGQVVGGVHGGRTFFFEGKKAAPAAYYTGSSASVASLSGKWANPVPCLDALTRWEPWIDEHLR